MPYEHLWTPWRLGYIQGEERPPQTPDEKLRFLPGADPACFLCRGLADDADQRNLLALRGEQALVMLNRYPYNNGHLLIAPKRHIARLDQLSDAEHLECQHLLARFQGILERILKAQGFNVGLNLGHVAGAGLPSHLHWHIVPRWSGDTSFMPVLSGVRLIPQSLEALWEALQNELGS